MNETVLTVRGYVGSEVSVRVAGDTQVASFRIGCTPRRLNRRTNAWVDAPTQWFTVSTWRQLADNVAASVRKGDAVVVHGRLSVHPWIDNLGAERLTYEIDADVVGHDLNRGTTMFRKPPREVPAAPDPWGGRAGEAPAGRVAEGAMEGVTKGAAEGQQADVVVDPLADWRIPGDAVAKAEEESPAA